ncbi:hypothetical protein BH24ACT1_BH24ACT1_01030 [soil metagenome]
MEPDGHLLFQPHLMVSTRRFCTVAIIRTGAAGEGGYP